MVAKSNSNEFIKKSISKHGSKYDYSHVIYISARKKVNIICNTHGSFLITPNNHLSGKGCPKCYKTAALTNEEFLKRANIANSNNFIYLSQYKNMSTNILVQCKKCNYVFKQLCRIHIRGVKCKCELPIRSFDEFVKNANIVHNNKYNYFSFINLNTKIDIECKIHGLYKQYPYKHLKGSGCRLCGNKNSAIKHTKTNKEFLDLANKIHDFKYKYLTNYCGTLEKIKIECNEHGIFWQKANSHLSGAGCRKCKAIRKTNEEFLIQANSIHNNKYIYNSKYINKRTAIEIICPKHGAFNQKPIYHLRGIGCKLCSPPKSISKQEIQWLDTLNIKNEFRQHVFILKNKKYIVDGYDPETNTIYEFYGDYWHGNPKKFNHSNVNLLNNKTFKQLFDDTMNREANLISFGYKLVSIWESDWKNEQSNRKKDIRSS